MKKTLIFVFAALLLMSAKKDSGAITKENGVYVVNTTTLCDKVEGYNGPVPVKIFIKDGKVDHIEVLKNQEDAKYLVKVKRQLLHAWDGLTVKEAQSKKADAVTGATFTSKALIKNVQTGLNHFQTSKKK